MSPLAFLGIIIAILLIAWIIFKEPTKKQNKIQIIDNIILFDNLKGKSQ